MAEQYEAWLRGPVEGVPALLQPVAHALVQAREEIVKIVRELPPDRLWSQPGGVASVGFHLQHVSGVLDRLFTYARGAALSADQREALGREGVRPESGGSLKEVLERLDANVERALMQLRATDPDTLTQPRVVGRQQLPSTVLGLLFHAAEHTQRHVGQMLVTARVQSHE